MPLGKLSKSQIVKGFEVLDKIQAAIEKKSNSELIELSNQFYTVIPHDFGRQRPPIINDLDHLRKKLDMLLTLGDIELTQEMLKNREEISKKEQGVKLLTNFFLLGLEKLFKTFFLIQNIFRKTNCRRILSMSIINC